MKHNMLVLAMSTLPGSGRPVKNIEFTYAADGTRIRNCQYQLEPIAKLMAEKVDGEIEILALSTGPTKEKQDVVVEGENGNLEHRNVSAQEFFDERLHRDYGDRIRITYIDSGEFSSETANTEPNLGLEEAVRRIRSFYSEEGHGELWIDFHGGLRDSSTIFIAIINLLKVDSIIPDQILGVETGKNRIYSQKRVMQIFDFVSGMNEFINYGSDSLLKEFYKGESRKEIKDVLSSIDVISEGTQFCDPAKYLEGINSLKSSIHSLPQSESMISIFSDYIQSDYGALLTDPEPSPLLIIRRCLKKNLIQQALTFTESMMPEEFVKSGFIRYTLPRGTSLEGKKPSYLSADDFVVDSYVYLKLRYFEDTGEKLIKNSREARSIEWKDLLIIKAVQNFADQKDVLEKAVREQKPQWIPATTMEQVFLKNNATEYSLGNRENTIQVRLSTGLPVGLNMFGSKLIHMHKALKGCRNFYNHSNSQRPSLDQIKTVLELYLVYAETLLPLCTPFGNSGHVQRF